MKLFLSFTFLCAMLAGCATSKQGPPQPPKTTFSSFDQPVRGVTERVYGPNEMNVKRAELNDFLNLYQEISGRTVITTAQLPGVLVSVRNQTPVTRVEALQLCDTVLAENYIAMVLVGEKAVKAVPIRLAAQEAGPVVDLPADKLPDSGSFMVRIVHLKKCKPSELLPLVQPFAKVPNGIIPMDKERTLVLRDFASNIRQMLTVIDIAEGSGGH